ncbi:MAG: hypothetical protein EBX65_07200, partial [Betaproteobacteria bacterium]|nr:hypothetical protein [Betaproteobacteria bacterium]
MSSRIWMRMRRARQTGSIWPGKAFGIRSGLKLRYSWQVTLASGSQGPMRVLKFVCDGADLMAVPISEVPFFDGMSGEDLAEIMLLTRTKTFAAGQQVERALGRLVGLQRLARQGRAQVGR